MAGEETRRIVWPLALAFFFQRYLVRGAFVGSTSGE